MKRILIVFIFFYSTFTNSQTIPKSFEDLTTWQTFKYDIGSVFKGIGHSYSRPLHWKGKQWLNFAGVAAGTTLLTFVDDAFDDWTDGIRGKVPNSILDFGHRHTRPEGNYGLTGAVYFTGLFIKDERLEQFQSHLLWQTTLMQTKLWPHYNYRTTRIVNTFSK